MTSDIYSSLDPETKAYLETVLRKNPEDLSADEQGFLRARASYLTNDQKRIFASVLGKQPEQPQEHQPNILEKLFSGNKPEAAVSVPVASVSASDHGADPDWQPVV